MIIYKTTNLINNKIYIGKDKNNNPSYMGSGKIIKKAINKYKKENFKKEILEYCFSEEELNEKEIYWIAFLNSTDKNIGYNIQKGGYGGISFNGNKNGMFGTNFYKLWIEKYGINKANELAQLIYDKIGSKVSGKNNGMYGKSVYDIWAEKYGLDKADELKTKMNIKRNKSLIGNKGRKDQPLLEKTKQLLSELMTGDKNPNYGKGEKIIQKDLNGNFIKEWNNANQAKNELNFKQRTSIDYCCKKKTKQAFGFIWEYKR